MKALLLLGILAFQDVARPVPQNTLDQIAYIRAGVPFVHPIVPQFNVYWIVWIKIPNPGYIDGPEA